MSECKHCGVDSDEYYMRDGYCLECAYSAKDSTIARLTQELEEAKSECKRREDFGPHGDATTPGFFMDTKDATIATLREENNELRRKLEELAERKRTV